MRQYLFYSSLLCENLCALRGYFFNRKERKGAAESAKKLLKLIVATIKFQNIK